MLQERLLNSHLSQPPANSEIVPSMAEDGRVERAVGSVSFFVDHTQ